MPNPIPHLKAYASTQSKMLFPVSLLFDWGRQNTNAARSAVLLPLFDILIESLDNLVLTMTALVSFVV